MTISFPDQQDAAKTQILGVDDNYVTLSGTTQQLSDAIALVNGRNGVAIQLDIDFVPTPTDKITVSVYSSLDGVVYDTIPIHEFEVDNTVDLSKLALKYYDYPYLKVGVAQTGATDSNQVKIYSRRFTR